jgi:hypothetical protein
MGARAKTAVNQFPMNRPSPVKLAIDVDQSPDDEDNPPEDPEAVHELHDRLIEIRRALDDLRAVTSELAAVRGRTEARRISPTSSTRSTNCPTPSPPPSPPNTPTDPTPRHPADTLMQRCPLTRPGSRNAPLSWPTWCDRTTGGQRTAPLAQSCTAPGKARRLSGTPCATTERSRARTEFCGRADRSLPPCVELRAAPGRPLIG